MRARGYRPIQIWVPDVRSDAFAAEVTAIMCGAADLRVALKVDIGTGPNWDEAH